MIHQTFATSATAIGPPPPPPPHHLLEQHSTRTRTRTPGPATVLPQPPLSPPQSLPSPMPTSSERPPCPHLATYHLSSRPLRFLHCCLRVRPLGRPEIRRDPRELPPCWPCAAVTLSPASHLYAYLSYAVVFCPSHASSSAGPGHQIAVHVDRAKLFYAVCGDQVYDPDFDHAIFLAQSPSLLLSTSYAAPSPVLRKRRRVNYRTWAPDPAEFVLMSFADPTTSASAAAPAGLRGLNNLGNTFFMNSVLQALLHAPPLRNYFLGDRHNHFLCPRRMPVRHRAAEAEAARVACLACDLDEIYSVASSAECMPYSPAKFLYRSGLWISRANRNG